MPLLYLDNVADAMLKGLDQQVSVLRYSIADSSLSILLLFLLLPLYGVKGYVIVLYASTFLNAALSIARLAKVTCISADPILWVGKPVCSIVLSAAAVSAADRILPVLRWDIFWKIPITLLLYVLLLFLSGSLTGRIFDGSNGCFKRKAGDLVKSLL